MATVPSTQPFTLQINSLDDFERFLSIIRTERLNSSEDLQKLATKLKDSQIALQTAVENSKQGA